MVLENEIVKQEVVTRVRSLLSEFSRLQNIEATASNLKSYITTIVPTEYVAAFTLEERTAIEDAVNKAIAFGQAVQDRLKTLQIKRW